MSVHRRDRDYLYDIWEAMNRILLYTSALDYDRFMEDTKTQDAVLRNLQVDGRSNKSCHFHYERCMLISLGARLQE